MTQEQQDKLRRALYNAKFTTDAEDENPFVGIYFQDLLGIIANYDNNPNWFSVEERLPKEKQKVLAYFSPNEECEHEYACMALYNYGFHHWEDAEDTGIILEGITHWMALPQPPIKEE